MERFFLKLPPSNKTFRFFDKGDYHVLMGEHARRIVDTFFATESALKLDRTVPYCNLNPNMFQKVIRSLILEEEGATIEVYSQSSSRQYELDIKAVPGDPSPFADLLFSTDSDSVPPTRAFAHLKKQADSLLIHLAIADPIFRVCHVTTLVDNEGLTSLESTLLSRNCHALSCSQRDMDVLSSLDRLRGSAIHLALVVSDSVTPSSSAWNIPEQCLGPAVTALRLDPALHGALAAVLRDLNPKSTDGTNLEDGDVLWRCIPFKADGIALLPATTIAALDVVPSEIGTPSLYQYLNQTSTSHGARLLRRWVTEPLTSVDSINQRLDAVESLVDVCVPVAAALGGICDFERLAIRLGAFKGNLSHTVRLFESVRTLDEISRNYESILIFTRLRDALEPLSNFLSLCNHTLERTGEECRIKADFDPELQRLAAEQETVRERMEEERARIVEISGLTDRSVKINHNGVHKFHFKVGRKLERDLRDIEEIQGLGSQKSGFQFTTEDMRVLSRTLIDLIDQYENCQAAIEQEFFKVAADFKPYFLLLSEVTAELDVLTGFAKLARRQEYPLTRPTLVSQDSDRCLEIMDGRHPLIESTVEFVSNSVSFSADNREFLVVTGPNSGGKTVFLRQVISIALMAQIGSFVPAFSCRLTPFDGFFARVGASDSLFRGLSTFMTEMTEIGAILSAATERSIIVVDELGRGTSTYDGFGLAHAITTHLAENVHAFTLFATHFHEIANLADDFQTIHNVHVVADVIDKQLVFTYKIKDGSCHRSFGIEVARLIGFPNYLLSIAEAKHDQLEAEARRGDDSSSDTTLLNSNEEDIIVYLLNTDWEDAKTEDFEKLEEMLQKFQPN